MLFYHQLLGELRKLFARPRTWMGYGAFFAMEFLITVVYKLEGSQRLMKGILVRNGLDFGSYYSSLTITFTIMLFSMVLLGSIYFALVAGDIVAKENEDGNLRLVFARPISRLRLLIVKYTAVSIYTISFVFFVGVTGYAMAVLAVGWEGGLFVMEPKMMVFAAYPEWSEGAGRLLMAAGGIGLSMLWT
jgi:ABC-2 type transport system permease protein